MKLSDYKIVSEEFSGKASDVARQLSFAGVAIVWILKGGGSLSSSLLLLVLIGFVLSLTCDLLHYIWGTIIWSYFRWSEEGKLKDLRKDPELCAPRWYNYPTWTLFVLKLLFIVASYIVLALFVIGEL